MSTISKERRDAIRAVASDPAQVAIASKGGLAIHILALLDALDAAEKAEPVAVKPLEWGGGDMPLRDRELRAIVDALAASPEAK